MSTRTKQDGTLMDEDGIVITPDLVTTPHGEYRRADIRGVSRKLHKPVWGPFLLAALGTINVVAAMQTGTWFDWAAALLMLGGGIYWRSTGTRHVLMLEVGEKKIDAWYASSREQCDRAAGLLENRTA
jgi:hypothetical protein